MILVSAFLAFVLREPVPRLIDNRLAYQIDNVNGCAQIIFSGCFVRFHWWFLRFSVFEADGFKIIFALFSWAWHDGGNVEECRQRVDQRGHVGVGQMAADNLQAAG